MIKGVSRVLLVTSVVVSLICIRYAFAGDVNLEMSTNDGSTRVSFVDNGNVEKAGIDSSGNYRSIGGIDFNGPFAINGSSGTVGQFLSSNGAGLAPSWQSISGGSIVGVIRDQITLQAGSVFYVSSGSVQGPLTVYGNIIGNGSQITSLTPANISAGTAGINITGNAATATAAITATTATWANHLVGGAVGYMPYQNSASSTTFLVSDVTSNGRFLRSNGAAAPTWVDVTTLNVSSSTYSNTSSTATYAVTASSANYATYASSANYANTASTATYAITTGNLAGGQAGVVPYQYGTDLTTFTALGNSGDVLQANGSSAPTWVAASSNAVANSIAKRDSLGALVVATPVIGSHAATKDYVDLATAAIVAASGNYIANQDTLQAGATFYVSSGTVTNLTVGSIAGNGSALTNLTPANISAGTAGINITGNAATATVATTATWANHLVGGAVGYMPYQNSASSTTYLVSDVTTNGRFLRSNGAAAPTWVDVTSVVVSSSNYSNTSSTATYAVTSSSANYANTASTATYALTASTANYSITTGNLAGGQAGVVPYQYGTDLTTFTALGNTGDVLQSNGAAAPSWIAASSNAVVNSIAKRDSLGALVVATPVIGSHAATKDYVDLATAAIAATSGNFIANQNTLQAGATFYVSSGTVTNLTVGSIAGNGSALTNLTPANISAGTAGIDISGNAATATAAVTATTATWAHHLVGGSIGYLPFQNSASSTTFLVSDVSTDGRFLRSNGAAAPTWVDVTSVVVSSSNYSNTSSTATYAVTASSSNYSNFSGTATYALTSSTANYAVTAGTATYALTASTANYAITTGNLAGGQAGVVPYQYGTDLTTFTALGNAGDVLQSNGASAPTWIAASSNAVVNSIAKRDSLGALVVATPVIGSHAATKDYVDLATAAVAASSSSYIQNRDTLQVGATFYVSSGTIDGQTILARTSGNVGIGTASPSNLLDVNGSASFGSTGKSTFTAAGALAMASNTDITIAGTGKVRGLTATPTFADEAASKAYVDLATATLSASLLSGNTNYIQNRATLQTGATFYVSSASVDGQTLLARTSGRVGIGTSSPQSLFEIHGSSPEWVMSMSNPNQWGRFSIQAAGGPYQSYFGQEGSTGGHLMAWSQPYSTLLYNTAGAVQIGTTNSLRMTIDAVNGNVGIGPTVGTPPARLSVESTFLSGNAQLFDVGNGTFSVLANGSMVVNGSTYTWPSTPAGTTKYLQNDGGGNLSWQTLSGGGNVSTVAGTTDRSVKFTGASSIGDGSILDQGSGVVMTIDSSSNVIVGTLSKSTFTATGALTMASNTDITINGTGKVRGLTATPTFADEAASKAYVDLATSTLVSSLASGNTNYIQNRATLQTGATFYVSSGTIDGQTLLAKTSGNVGVGVVNPQSKLHLGGDLRLDGSSSNYTILRSSAVAGNVTLTLPASAGTSGQYLQTDGNGVMSWQTVLAGGGNVSTAGGTTNRSAKFTGASSVGDGSIVDTGSTEAMRIDGSQNVGFGSGVAKSTFSSTGALTMASNTDLTITGTGKVRGLTATPTFADEAASKAYVDFATAAVSGGFIQNRATLQTGATFYVSSGSVAGNLSVGGNVTGTWAGNTIDVPHGGTGLTSLATGSLVYGSGASAMSSLAAGTPGYILQMNVGGTAPQWVSSNTLSGNFILNTNTLQAGASYSVSSGSVAGDLTVGGNVSGTWAGNIISPTRGGTGANLSGASQGGVPYFGASGVMGSTAQGVSGEFLQSTGSGIPVWVSSSSIIVSSSTYSTISTTATYAYTASTATYALTASSASYATYAATSNVSVNLLGGQAGVIPYQYGTNLTTFTIVGTPGYLLQSNGAGAPTWISTTSLASSISGNFIANQATLQSGATFYVSSGTVDGQTILARTSGNVGVGVVNPTNFKVEVAGNVGPSVDNTYALGSAAYRWSSVNVGPGSVHVHRDNSGSDKVSLQFTGTTAQLAASATRPLVLMTGTSTGVVVAASGNVGIVTTTPATQLDVQGDAQFGTTKKSTFTTTGDLYIASASSVTLAGGGEVLGLGASPSGPTAAASKAYVDAQVGSVGGNFIQNTASLQSGATFYVSSGSVDGQTLLARTSGNVGIGVAAPTEKLDVSGNINMPTTSSSAGVLKINGSPFMHNYRSGVYIGNNAGNTSTPSDYNVAIGYNSMPNTTAAQNVGVGYFALNANTSGGSNTAVGPGALSILQNGSLNTALGNTAGSYLVTGGQNTALGHASMYNATSSVNRNVAVGYYAGQDVDGDYNTFVGALTGKAASGSSITRATAIGYNAKVSSSSAIILGGTGADAVNVAIGTSGPSALLDVSGNGAIRVPRAGSDPSGLSGMIYYNSGSNVFRGHNGTAWADLGSGGSLPSASANQTMRYDGSAWIATGTITNTGSNVGIGTTTPATALEVVQNRSIKLGNAYFSSGDAGNGINYAHIGNNAWYAGVAGGGWQVQGSGSFIQFSSKTVAVYQHDSTVGSITLGKMTAAIFDPPYTINGEKYATYAPAITGAKEETTGILTLNKKGNRYESEIDFSKEPKGSDLWLFAKATNMKADDNFHQLVVIMTPEFDGTVWYRKDAGTKKVTFYAKPAADEGKSVSVSYRLTAPRFDYKKWPNQGDPDSPDGLIIND